MNKFWEKFEEGIAGNFNVRLLAQSFAFWGIGVLLVSINTGWDNVRQYLENIGATEGIAYLIILLFVLEISNWLGDWFKLPMLQMLEGYWKKPFLGLREWRSSKARKKVADIRIEFDELSLKDVLSPEEAREFKKLECKSNEYPEDYDSILPTKLGNLIKASELYSYEKYGLEILTVFPRLWLVLTENSQKEISEARSHLDNQVKLVMLGLALFLWSFLAWWIVFVGIFIMLIGYLRALSAAESYGLLLRTAFDLYRFDLFEKLHVGLPDSPKAELDFGLKVTQYLNRGFFDESCTFTHPKKN